MMTEILIQLRVAVIKKRRASALLFISYHSPTYGSLHSLFSITDVSPDAPNSGPE